jgi:hypothetical protein
LPNTVVDLLHGKNKKILDYSPEELAWLNKINANAS